MGWDVLVSGISAGYFIGWALRFVESQRRTPHVELVAAQASPAAPSL
jgi:hypothetical protein